MRTKKAGIILTFYKKRGREEPLEGELRQILSRFPEIHNKFLIHTFRLPSIQPDSTIVQMAIEGKSGDAAGDWPELIQLLQKAKLPSLLDKFAEKESLWGYSVIYSAELLAEGLGDSSHFNKETASLRSLARRPDLKPVTDNTDHTLVYSSLPLVGHLWLMDIPNQNHGRESAIVYMALSLADKDSEMTEGYLLGNQAKLLIPDLIAHKAYHQKREYRGEPLKLYGSHLQKLEKAMEPMLSRVHESEDFLSDPAVKPSILQMVNSKLTRWMAEEILSQKIGVQKRVTAWVAKKNLDDLKEDYMRLLSATTYLEKLQISISQQIQNYKWWVKSVSLDTLRYHNWHMDMGDKELGLQIRKGRNFLGAIHTAIELVQADQNIRQEQRENRIMAWIAVIGTALAATQIIDADAASAILDIFTAPACTDIVRLKQLGVQFIATILIALTMWRLMIWWTTD
ncbi:MAG: hypothetical protein B6244_11070 [Candidatus Cloacimonetes bacterium 4572_55]|nr:MAG: hypothetical protein B6244_11070 [Candidatus Cloacimonetes bacterium 4572_55]